MNVASSRGFQLAPVVSSELVAVASNLAMNRAARRHVESPALRLTRYYCRHGLEQPAAAMRHLLLVVRTRNQRMDFSRPSACVSVALPSLRLSEEAARRRFFERTEDSAVVQPTG